MDKLIHITDGFINSVKHMKRVCSNELVHKITSECHAITRHCKGDGAGLSGGTLIDMYMTGKTGMVTRIPECAANHKGESDLNIASHPFSLKKITGKSEIALGWSKNAAPTPSHDLFQCDLMIINLTEHEQWWKREWILNDKSIQANELGTSLHLDHVSSVRSIPEGIYFIPRSACLGRVLLRENNKSTSLIDSYQLYVLLLYSMKHEFMIPFPPYDPLVQWTLERGFHTL